MRCDDIHKSSYLTEHVLVLYEPLTRTLSHVTYHVPLTWSITTSVIPRAVECTCARPQLYALATGNGTFRTSPCGPVCAIHLYYIDELIIVNDTNSLKVAHFKT